MRNTALLFATLSGLAAFAAPRSAHAGGIGPIVMGGVHTERLFFYSNRADNGDGALFDDFRNYEQFEDTQGIGQFGGGLELVLGDRDDQVQGVFRLLWNMDGGQTNPADTTELVNPDAVVAEVREDLRHTGIGTVGIQWSFHRSENNKLRLTAGMHLGSGFMTDDHTEYLLGQLGVGASYLIARNLEFVSEVSAALRFRKEAMPGAMATVGIRALFD